jgi:hypothetical protein
MTEQEWLECTDPQPMLDFLRSNSKASDRKLRLFACACCRRIWHLLLDDVSRKAVEVGERFADGHATEDERYSAYQAADDVWAMMGDALQLVIDQEEPDEPDTMAEQYALAIAAAGVNPYAAANAAEATVAAVADSRHGHSACGSAALGIGYANAISEEVDLQAQAGEQVAQCQLIRDISDNPFRPAVVEPGWLTPAVVSVAQSIYDDRAFNRLPILADALEEAGCHDPDILQHCRQPGEHVRGCWAIDLILGKE